MRLAGGFMDRKKVRMRYAVVVLIAVALVLAALVFTKYGIPRKETGKAPKKKGVPVVVAPVCLSSISETLEISGEIEARQTVIVKPKVPGRLEQLQTVSPEGGKVIPVREGVRVQRGQQIAQIDHEEYLAQVKRAEAVLAEAAANREQAEKDHQRYSQLMERKVIAVQQYEKMKTAYALSQAEYQAAQANLDLAKIQLRESTIVSPLTGVVTQKHIDEGNIVHVDTPIVTIVNIQTVKVVAGVPERYLKKIQPGKTPATIQVDAFPERDFTARVERVYPAIDLLTRTLQVELTIANKENLLGPGMFARVFFALARKDNTVVVQRDMVLGSEGGERYVYIVANQQAHRAPVKLGLQQGDLVEVLEGLKPGDQLVTNGMNYLQEGAEVEIIEEGAEK
jgi:membrane fusion protein (multidrug efflux system)